MLISKPSLRRRLIGIATLLVVAAGLVVVALRPDPFTDRQTVWAKFDNVNGLGSIDRDIRVAGVNEGEIGAVERVGDDALVELEVNPEIVLHSDAQVALRPHTLFEGSAFVDLHPGSPSAPPIDEGTTIPLRQTRVYVSFDEALRVLREPARERLRELVRIGAEATADGSTESVQRTLRAAPELTRDLGPTARALQGSGRVELRHAIGGMAGTVSELARREDSLTELAGRANRTLAALDVDGAGPLDRALAALPGPLETLRDRGRVLDALVDRTGELAVALRPALRELAPALDELQPVLAASAPAARRAVPLVHAIGTVLRRSAAAAPAFERLLTILRPGQRLLDENVLPALHRKSRLGMPAYMQLISAFAGGNAALRPYQTEAQGALGAGHMFRLGSYFDPAGTSGADGFLPCDSIGQLDPGLVASLRVLGFCT